MYVESNGILRQNTSCCWRISFKRPKTWPGIIHAEIPKWRLANNISVIIIGRYSGPPSVRPRRLVPLNISIRSTNRLACIFKQPAKLAGLYPTQNELSRCYNYTNFVCNQRVYGSHIVWIIYPKTIRRIGAAGELWCQDRHLLPNCFNYSRLFNIWTCHWRVCMVLRKRPSALC